MSSSLADPVYLQDQYEALRREAGETDPLARRGHGLALFISRGMTAWIRALAALVGRSQPIAAAAAPSPTNRIPALPAARRSELTTVLADMVLCCSPEVLP